MNARCATPEARVAFTPHNDVFSGSGNQARVLALIFIAGSATWKAGTCLYEDHDLRP